MPERVPAPAVEIAVVLGDSVVAVHYLSCASSFRVGRGVGVDLTADVDDATLVSPGAVFVPVPGVRLVAGQAGPIALGARLRAEVGPLALLVAGVAPPVRAAKRPGLDRRALGYGVVSAAVHAGLLALCLLVPASARGFADDELGRQLRATRTSFRPVEERPVVGAPSPLGPEGERSPRQDPAPIRHGAQAPRAAPPSDRLAHARSAGVLGILAAQRDALDALDATGDFSHGLDDADIRTSWLAPGRADDRGFGGGLRGPGPGAGGHEPGTIGAGPYRTPGTTLRLPRADLPGRRPHAPTLEFGAVQTPPTVDKETIRRYVRAHIDAIAFCYDRELTVRPDLAGTLVAEFTIRTDGRVLAASARGLGDVAVERCVEEVIRGIAFPAAPTTIHVSAYPFTFRPAGGER
jgi:hypothetical protein